MHGDLDPRNTLGHISMVPPAFSIPMVGNGENGFNMKALNLRARCMSCCSYIRRSYLKPVLQSALRKCGNEWEKEGEGEKQGCQRTGGPFYQAAIIHWRFGEIHYILTNSPWLNRIFVFLTQTLTTPSPCHPDLASPFTMAPQWKSNLMYHFLRIPARPRKCSSPPFSFNCTPVRMM